MYDLGWNNYDREFAYIHPAVVIKETATKIFIVPCSSGTPRKDKNGMLILHIHYGLDEKLNSLLFAFLMISTIILYASYI